MDSENGTTHAQGFSSTACCAAAVGRYSRTSSRSRTGSVRETASNQQSSLSRPHSRLQMPPQQQDACMRQHHQHPKQGHPAQQQVCSNSSAEHQHGMSPGQIPRPSSRLGHHTDMHHPCQQELQLRPGSSSAGTCPVDNGIEAGAAAEGPYAAMGYASRQHSSRGVRSSTNHCCADSSHHKSSNQGTAGSGLRSRPGTGSISGTKQQRQQQCSTSPGVAQGSSLNDSHGMTSIPEQHMTRAACANPLYANCAATSSMNSSSNAISTVGNTASPVVTPRRLVASYAAALAAPAVPAVHTLGSLASTNINTTQPATMVCPGSSSGKPADTINAGNQQPGSMHSPTVLGATAVVIQQQQQPPGAGSLNLTAAQKSRSCSRQGCRPSSSGILGTSNSSGSRQQQTNSAYKPQIGVLSQDPAPAISKVAAAYLGSSNSSRPSTASGWQGAHMRPAVIQAGTSPELHGLSRQQRQQSAISTTSGSVLATPRNNSNSSNSSNYWPQSSSMRRPDSAAAVKPGSASTRTHQQKAAHACGPLLSEYFRPPSAAAPGCIGLFGLPGMEPPGGLASAIPCVKVPTVHASWDAAVAGLSLSSISCAAAAALSASQPDSAQQHQQQQLRQPQEQPGSARSSVQPKPRPTTQPGPVRTGTSSSALQPAAVRPGTSSRAQRPSTGGCLATDGSGTARQQLLLWSAAHEIDGRPVTRNGERASRPQSRSAEVPVAAT